VNLEELDFGALPDAGSNPKLSEFLTFAPVLLRVQNRRVVTELAVTATADLLPELSFCSLLSIDDTTNRYSLTAHRNNHLLSQEENNQLLSQLPEWLFFLHDRPKILKDRSNAAELAQALGEKEAFLVAVRTPTHNFGYFLGGTSQELTAETWSYLRSLAELTAIALDNATRFDDLKEAAYEMGLVNEMAGSLAASLNGEELFNSFISRLHSIVPIDRVNLALLPPVGETYSLPFCWDSLLGRSRRTYLKNLTLDGSPFEEAIQRQEIITGFWDKPGADLTYEEVNVFNPVYRSQMVIPLIAKRKLVGALALGVKDEGTYQEDSLRRSLLEKLAALFALALLNSRLYEEKQLSAEFDSRVGVYNHDFFDRELTAQIRRSRQDETMLGLMMVDMDNLKLVNDKHGHLAGDEALRHVANMINNSIRATDVVARYGGDEFGVMLPGCTPMGLEVVAEKTRRTINNTPLILESGEQVSLSVSIGAVLCPDDARTPRDLIQRADAAMYIAKQYRNQVRIGATARLPHVTEIELTSPDSTDKPNPSENLTEWLAEDYERFLLWVGGNRTDIESKILHELNERLHETSDRLAESLNYNARLKAGLWGGLKVVAEIIERREPYMAGGAGKLVKLVRLIGEKINLPEEEIRDLEAAAWLSNLGRVLIPESIWKSQAKLSEDQWQCIRQIPPEVVGILGPFEQLLSKDSLEAVKLQRENFDGSGYPMGLVGEEIPRPARILGIASAVVAMSQDRPYRSRRTKITCQRQLERGAGRQFDPELASLLITQFGEGQLEFLDFA
jgi:diguanylate cyclase (GGDEF)-like protein